MGYADNYANAAYKYLKWLGEVTYYTNKYENPPGWSVSRFVHETLQAITEIQKAYNGGNTIKWGCKSPDEVIDQMVEAATKLQGISEEMKAKWGTE